MLDLDRVLPDPTAPHAPPPVDEERDGAFSSGILTEAEMEALERENTARALEASVGKISGPGGAAELLGIHPNTLT